MISVTRRRIANNRKSFKLSIILITILYGHYSLIIEINGNNELRGEMKITLEGNHNIYGDAKRASVQV